MNRIMSLVSLLTISLAAHAVSAQDATSSGNGLFPFVVSYDAPDNATNISDALERPAGKGGFIRVENGHLASDNGPLRIWGTNFCFDACFPEHEDAESVAARLARFGINCVRLHHMDARSIWGESPDKLAIDPKQLDKLDYLIHQLKEHGVYVNINLHVSRQFGDAEGFPHKDQRPKYDKGLDNFEPRMIEYQKKFARDLLTHVNPYTGKAYVDEPAVAMIEINNENGLFLGWRNGDLDDLPDPYASEFRRQWNAWLKAKYGTTSALRNAWSEGAVPLGEELLASGAPTIQEGRLAAPWNLQRDDQCEVGLSVGPNGPNGQDALRMDVKKLGRESWVPQLMVNGLSCEKGTPYTVELWTRADEARECTINFRKAVSPWGSIGLSRRLKLTPEWKRYRFTYRASDDEDGTARIDFSSFTPGVYELAGLSLREGGIEGLAEDASLEAGTVPIVKHGNLNITPAALADFVDFLWETERDYWTGMHTFIRDELGAKPIVAGTQAVWSPMHVQAMLDYCDGHAYWNHPAFPGKPWDRENWYVKNIALTNHLGEGTLTRLAGQRTAGKPFTVSEYNHPAPNYYAAEGFPMIAAFGRFQDWDGIFPFTYANRGDWTPDRITGYFDIRSDPTRMVHMIACSNMFLRGDVDPAKQTVLIGMDREKEREILREELSPRSLNAGQLGLDPRVALEHAVAVSLAGNSSNASTIPENADRLASDTRQLFYDLSDENGGGATLVRTPRSLLITGFGQRRYDLGEMKIAVGPTRMDWSTITVTALDAERIGAPGRHLIAATGWMQNTGQKTQDLGNDRITLGKEWGEGPVLCEGVPALVELNAPSDGVQAWALDAAGNRATPVPVETTNGGKARIELDPKYKTLWYEVEVR